MGETIAHLALEIVHEVIGFSRCLLFEILQELACHVRALSQHVVQIAKAVFSRLFLVGDVCVHLLTFPVDICHNLTLIGNSSLFLFDESICDSLDLRSDWVQCVIVILDSIFFFL